MISGAAVSKENDAIKAVLHANRSMAHINMVNFKFIMRKLISSRSYCT